MHVLTTEELEQAIQITPSASNSFNAKSIDQRITVSAKGPSREIVRERWFAEYYKQQYVYHNNLAGRLKRGGDMEGHAQMMGIANNYKSLYSVHTKAGKKMLSAFMAEMEKERELMNNG